MKEAGQQALRAGLDVGISYESGFMLDLVASVREGLVPEALVDRAVRRILRQKLRLGLFERHQVDLDHAADGPSTARSTSASPSRPRARASSS